MPKGKYPQVIYVVKERDQNDNFLVAYENAAGHAVVDEDVEVAIYNLSSVRTVKAKAVIE